jgi:hypothetical protein
MVLRCTYCWVTFADFYTVGHRYTSTAAQSSDFLSIWLVVKQLRVELAGDSSLWRSRLLYRPGILLLGLYLCSLVLYDCFDPEFLLSTRHIHGEPEKSTC